MPKPVEEHFFVPVAASCMAVEAHMESEAPPRQGFSDFFTAKRCFA